MAQHADAGEVSHEPRKPLEVAPVQIQFHRGLVNRDRFNHTNAPPTSQLRARIVERIGRVDARSLVHQTPAGRAADDERGAGRRDSRGRRRTFLTEQFPQSNRRQAGARQRRRPALERRNVDRYAHVASRIPLGSRVRTQVQGHARARPQTLVCVARPRNHLGCTVDLNLILCRAVPLSRAEPRSFIPAVWAAPLVFGSGFCALVYQMAWQREFRLIFGPSTAASAAVIAVFMGGLGLGGWMLGPRADRHGNPLRFYAVLEGLVGLTAFTTPWLLQVSRQAYLALGGTVGLGDLGGTALRLLLASLVLLPPTFFAGGKLRAGGRALAAQGDRWRTPSARAFGVGTAGGA